MKKLLFITLSLIAISCSREVTKEDALTRISTMNQYQTMYFAPMHIGRQVLTGENHNAPQIFIDKTYGKLITEELVEVKTKERNAWRTVIHITLTEKGLSMTDPRRSDNEHAFVAVCKVVPVAIDTIIPLGQDSLTCHYVIQQQEITPFGETLGFEVDRKYKVTTVLER